MTSLDIIKLSFLLFVLENNIFYIRGLDFVHQQFRRTPENRTAIIGEMVTLACSVTNMQGELQWTRDGFGLGTDRNLKEYDRYRMIGNEEEGDYTLVIDPVTLEDDAVFQCQVGPPWPLRSPSIKLTVEIPTGKPEILQGDYLQTTEGRQEQVECVSRGGKPPAEITWFDWNGKLIQESIRTIKELQEDGKSFNTRSILTFTPNKEMNNKTLTCQAHNRPSTEVMSDSIRLNVKYSPKVNLTIKPQEISEHDNVEVSCEAEGNPAQLKYRWFLNNQVVNEETSNVLLIKNISRFYHENKIKCEVSNIVGKSEKDEIILVNYGPTFIRKPENIQADLFTSVTLYCIVEGYPEPDITWFHEDIQNAIATTSTLTVAVARDTIGKYICRTSGRGLQEIFAESQILLKGPPKIESSKIQYGNEEESVKLECYAISVPRANAISWNHGEHIIKDDENYSVYEEYSADSVKSTLTIKSAKLSDFGPYNCTVSNSYGKCVMEIFVAKKESPNVVIILTAIIASFVGIISLIMLMLLCQRRRPRRSIFLSSTTMEPEKNNTNMSQLNASINNSTLKFEAQADTTSTIDEDSSEYAYGSNACCTLNNRNNSFHRYRNINTEPDPDIFASIKNAGHLNNGFSSFKRPADQNKTPELFKIGNTTAKPNNDHDSTPSIANGTPMPMPRPSTSASSNFGHPSTFQCQVNVFHPNNVPVTPVPPNSSFSDTLRHLKNSPSQTMHPQPRLLKPGTLDTHV